MGEFLKNAVTTVGNSRTKSCLEGCDSGYKSRKMKTLRDFQKRRYGTAQQLYPLHKTEMNIPSLHTRILQNCNVNAGDDRELSEHSAYDTDDPEEHLFRQGKIAVFRGTDGLPFDLLKVTRDYGYNITPRTKILANFFGRV